MVVTVTSPDGNVSARVTNSLAVDIAFRPGTYERYDEPRLSHQLARLGVAGFVGLQRGRSEAYRRSRDLSADELADAERPSTDPRRQSYEEELRQLRAEGVSGSGAVRIRTVGMTHWEVALRPGSLRRLDERAFVAELDAALRALLNDRDVKVIIVKSDHFDL